MTVHPVRISIFLLIYFQPYCTTERVKVLFLWDLEEGGDRKVEEIPPLAHPQFISAADILQIQCSLYLMRTV